LIIFDIAKTELIAKLNVGKFSIKNICISIDDQVIAVSSENGEVKLYSFEIIRKML